MSPSPNHVCRSIAWPIALALVLLAVNLSDEPNSAPTPTIPAPCEEDAPCWDCTTMGNQICGAKP